MENVPADCNALIPMLHSIDQEHYLPTNLQFPVNSHQNVVYAQYPVPYQTPTWPLQPTFMDMSQMPQMPQCPIRFTDMQVTMGKEASDVTAVQSKEMYNINCTTDQSRRTIKTSYIRTNMTSSANVNHLGVFPKQILQPPSVESSVAEQSISNRFKNIPHQLNLPLSCSMTNAKIEQPMKETKVEDSGASLECKATLYQIKDVVATNQENIGNCENTSFTPIRNSEQVEGEKSASDNKSTVDTKPSGDARLTSEVQSENTFQEVKFIRMTTEVVDTNVNNLNTSCDKDEVTDSTKEPEISLPSCIQKLNKPPVRVLNESLRCHTCDVYVNSENQMKQHVKSLRHKSVAQGIPIPPKPIKDEKVKVKSDQYRCTVCKVCLNSYIQMTQHLSSLRHKNMLEGKPQKPRWCPYERNPPSALTSMSVPFPKSYLSPYFIRSNTIGGQQVSSMATSLLDMQGSAESLLLPQHYMNALTGSSYMKDTPIVLSENRYVEAREVAYIACQPSFPSLPLQPLPQILDFS
nr:uncharacterized protein LOC100180364 isoform X2 [Ciona intestinalis]|eukprot:XP_002123956.1 uncharacterized protein LOC100180364 isoform X2 [Ciona intestinalis]